MSPIVDQRNVSIYIDVAEVRALRSLAGTSDRSMSGYIRQILLNHITNNPETQQLIAKTIYIFFFF